MRPFSRRPFSHGPVALLVLLLAACAPTHQANPVNQGAANPQPGTPTVRTAFSDQGVAWVVNGRACVARKPDYVPFCPRLGRAVDVGWNGNDAWAALPGVGLAVTLDRAAQSVRVGAVTAMTSNQIYREDGSAVGYNGAPAGQISGTPSQVITGGDGQDYALLAGNLRRVSDGSVVEPLVSGRLIATKLGVKIVTQPTLITDDGTYQLSGGMLERLDNGGRSVKKVADDAVAVGAVGQDIITVSAAGQLRHFTSDLQEF